MKKTFKVESQVTRERIADLLCSAFEGGIGYWARIVDYTAPARESRILGQRYTDWPLSGGAVILVVPDEVTGDDGDARLVLDGEAIERGLQLMAEKFPRRWYEFMSENEDAEDGDVFVQLCLFGEVVYG